MTACLLLRCSKTYSEGLQEALPPLPPLLHSHVALSSLESVSLCLLVAVHRAWSGCLEPPPVHEPSLHLRLLYGAAVAAVASREAESDSPSDCRGRPRGATRAIYTCANAANEIPDMAAAATTKELVCVDGEWRDADPLAPWPLC